MRLERRCWQYDALCSVSVGIYFLLFTGAVHAFAHFMH